MEKAEKRESEWAIVEAMSTTAVGYLRCCALNFVLPFGLLFSGIVVGCGKGGGGGARGCLNGYIRDVSMTWLTEIYIFILFRNLVGLFFGDLWGAEWKALGLDAGTNAA